MPSYPGSRVRISRATASSTITALSGGSLPRKTYRIMSLNTNTNQLSVELLSQIIDTNATGIIIINRENNIVFWNQWLEKTSQIKKENALNKNIFSLFPELTGSRINKAIDLSFSKGNASFISHAFNKKAFPIFSHNDINKPLQPTLHIKRVKLQNNELYCFIQICKSKIII